MTEFYMNDKFWYANCTLQLNFMKEKSKNTNSFLLKLRNYVDGSADTAFEFFMLFVIFANCIVLGLETSTYASKIADKLFIIDQVCLWIFIFELVLKIIAFNKDFFKHKWNIFDLVIVLVSIFSSLPYFTIFKVFKISRSIRIIKAIKSIKAVKVFKFINGLEHLQRIVRAIVLSVPRIAWTLILLFLFYYVYAILGTQLFASTVPQYFSTLGKSFLTLFQIMLFDDFGSIVRNTMAKFSWAWIYFVSFALISAFVIMNVIVGIVVDSIDEARREYIKKELGKNEITIEELSCKIDMLYKEISELNEKLKQK